MDLGDAYVCVAGFLNEAEWVRFQLETDETTPPQVHSCGPQTTRVHSRGPQINFKDTTGDPSDVLAQEDRPAVLRTALRYREPGTESNRYLSTRPISDQKDGSSPTRSPLVPRADEDKPHHRDKRNRRA